MEQKPPTAVVESAHRAQLGSLPLCDTTDFDDADRGFIAAQQPCVIKASMVGWCGTTTSTRS